ncbi:cytosine permease (plasmid) [Embleya sp. NBC_00888]|uniref:purine-cytosine permease family protein n=1 Tax=Embleya sp. NBC_00888 TaxID=2975960 RepID=UPI002F90DC91|nr:cytosine permease [Embleya sp. NBC_00888]
MSPNAPHETGGTPTKAVFDPHGIDPIPASGRDSTAWEQFWIWAGANIAPINWVLGALGVTLGLSLVETLLVVVVANIVGCAVFGVFNLMGHRTGVNQMVLGRSAFGRRGAILPGVMQGLLAMGWVGVNTWVVLDLAIAMLDELGITGGAGLQYLVAAVIMAVQLGLALFGFYAIRTFEKWTVPLTVVVMAVMTVVALTQVDLDWTGSTATSPGAKFTAVTQLVTAIGVGWAVSWLPYSGDYSRFVRPGTSGRKVVWATALGMYVPTVWLAALGACLASSGESGDPSQLVIGAFGGLALPVLLLVMHGPIATNILNLYSCSLAALSVGLRAARWKVTLASGAVATLVLLVFLRSDSFAHAFDNWMTSILVWISPWAGVVVVDFFVVRRGRPDVASLYETGPASRYPAFNRPGLISLGLGIVAAWSCQYGLVPVMRGPVARALGDIDLSWLAGLGVAGGFYYLLSRAAAGRKVGASTPPVRTDPAPSEDEPVGGRAPATGSATSATSADGSTDTPNVATVR